jgi:hypothetical protein
MGGDLDPFTPNVPGGETVTANDHEHYDLTPYIADGSTSIAVHTLNPSGDDNIFLETFLVSGVASINPPPPTAPEPASLLLIGTGIVGLSLVRRKKAN